MADQVETNGADGVSDTSSGDANLQTLDALHLDGKGAPSLDDADERSLGEQGDTQADNVTGNANVQSAGRTTFEQMVQGGIREEAVVPTADNVAIDTVQPTFRDNSVGARFDNIQPAFTPAATEPEPEARPEPTRQGVASPDLVVTRDPLRQPIAEPAAAAAPAPAAAAAPAAAVAESEIAAAPDAKAEAPRVEEPVTPKIADAPSLTVTAASGTEDRDTRLDITVATADKDGGTETISAITIGNVPTGFSFVNSAGQAVGTGSGGSWTFTQLELRDLYLRQPGNYSGDLSLTVSATSTESSGGSATTSAQLAVHVEAVADAPGLTTHNAAGMEDALIPLSITVGNNDATLEGTGAYAAETQTVYIDKLPAGATLVDGATGQALTTRLDAALVVGATTIPAGSYVVSAAQLATLKVQSAANDSHDFSLDVWATSREPSNGSIAVTGFQTIAVDVGIVAPAVSGSATGTEGQWTTLSLTGTVNHDLPGDQETLTVYIEGLPAGAQIRFADGSSPAATVVNGVTRYDVSGHLSDTQVRWTDSRADADMDLTVRGVVHDTDVGTATETALGNALSPDWNQSTANVHVTVQAVADGPSGLTAAGIGVEDKWFDLNITTGLIDTDDSETLSVTVTGPAGFTLAAKTDTAHPYAGVTSADGSTVTYTLSPAQLGGLQMRAKADSDADIDLSITATATETATGAGQIATASKSLTIPLTVKILSDADTPIVSVIKDTQTITEDALFDLSKSVGGAFSDGTGNHAAVSGGSAEVGSTLGAGASADASEAVTYRITANQDARLSLDGGTTSRVFAKDDFVTVSAADIATGKVQLGGPTDWASSTGQPNLTFKVVTIATEATNDDALGTAAALARATVRESAPAILTIAVDPVADVSRARLSVVASGYEDGLAGTATHTANATGAGIAVTPILTLADADHSETPTGLVTITSSDAAMIAGSLTISGSGASITRVDTTDGAGHITSSTWTVTGGNFSTTDHSAFTLTGLTFHPAANSDADPRYDLGVQFQDTNGGTTATLQALNQTITVQAVADAPTLSTAAAGGMESVSGTSDIALSITSALTDTDGSETLYVYVTGIPQGAATLSAYTSVSNSDVTIGGVTISGSAANPVYKLSAAQLTNLKLQVSQGTSEDMQLKVYAESVETTGGDVAVTGPATLNVDIGVRAPTITGADQLSGHEDAYISLANLATNRQAADATDSIAVYVEGLPAGASLYKLVGGTYTALTTTTYKDASGASHSGYDVTALRGGNGELSGVYVKWDAANKADDIGFTLRSVVADNDADPAPDAGGFDRNTAFGQPYNDITETTQAVSVRVIADADQPNLTASAIGVEDKWVALSIASTLVDTDNSETLTITVSGVPAGIQLSAGSIVATAANGQTTWQVAPAQLSGLRMTNLPANGDGDFTITVRATATEAETGDQVGTASSDREVKVTVQVLSDADKPVVSVVKDTQTINEDGLFSLASSVSGVFSDAASASHAAVTGTAGEAGSVQGASTSFDTSETITYSITANQESLISLDGGATKQAFHSGATFEVSAADLASGKVRVGGVADWASSAATPTLTFKVVAVATETNGAADTTQAGGLPAGLTRSSVAYSDPATLTIAVNPVVDVATATLTVTASGYEDGLSGFIHTAGATGSGIAVTPVLHLSDVDHSEAPTGTVTITSSDAAMIAGKLELSGGTITRVDTSDGAGHITSSTWTITGGTFATTATDTYQLTGLVFRPAADSAADPKFDLTVQVKDTTSGVVVDKTIANQTITVQAVADAPAVATRDTATWENDAGVRTIALDITSTRGADTDGSETLYVLITDLPSGAGKIIGTNVATITSGTEAGLTATTTNPIYKIPQADLASLRLEINQGYSTDLALKVYSETVEAENSDKALSPVSILKVDIGVLDPVISGGTAFSGAEDTMVSLSAVKVAVAAAGDHETLTTYVEAPAGVTLYNSSGTALTRITFTDAAGVSHSGYNVSTNVNAAGGLDVKAMNTTAHADADFQLRVFAIVKDLDAGTATDTAYASTYHDTAMSTTTIQVTVSAEADKPTLTASAIGVEDKSVALTINTGLVDTDGSETLTVTVTGVPAGVHLSAGTLIATDANGLTTWQFGPSTSNDTIQAQLSNLRLTGLPANSDADFALTVRATATERGTDGQVGKVSNSREQVVAVSVFADADKPVVDVLKGATIPTAETVGEDSLYNLKDAIKAYSGEEASSYVGHIADAYGWQSKDGSETLSFTITVPNACVIKVGATTTTMAAGGQLTVSAKDIVDGNVSVGGVGNWASSNGNDVLRFDLTPVATESDAGANTSGLAAANLTRAATATGDAHSFYLYVTPQADTTAIVVSASGLEDAAGIPIAPTITLNDADGSEKLQGFVEILVKCDAAGAFPGSITFSKATLVDGGVETYEGGTYHVFKVPVADVGVANNTYTLTGLNFVPTAESDLDVQYRVRVTSGESGNASTYATVSSLSTLTVAAVADAPVLRVGASGATTDAAGVVTVHDAEDGRSGGIVRLDLGAALKDADGSEVLSNVELRAVPTGWGVVTVNAAGTRVALTGADPDGDGKFTFVLDPAIFKAGSGLSVALVPPANSDVDVAGIQLWAKTTEMATASADRGAADTQISVATAEKTLTFNVQLDPVADQPTLMVTNARTSEDNSVALDIRASVNDVDETATVTITGMPNGGVLSYTDASGVVHATTFGNGVTALTCTAAEARSLRFTPPQDASGKYTLTVTATATDTDPEGLAAASTASRTATLDVSVKGVNDAILDAAGHAVNAASGTLVATGAEDAAGNLVNLGLGNYRINDVDNSETLSAVIQGLPAGITLVVKTASGVVETSDHLQYIGKDAHGDPIWSVPTQSLKDVYVQVPHNYAGSFSLSVRLVETEADGAATAYDKTLTVTVSPDADSPSGWVTGTYTEDHYGAGGGLAFSLNASVNDGNLNLPALGDGSIEHVTGLSASLDVDALVARNGGSTAGIHVTGPGNSDYPVQLVNGHYVIQISGQTVTAGTSVSLSGFTLYGVPKDWSADVPVSLSVTVTDGSGASADVETFTTSGSIVINPEADAPNLVFASADANHVYSAGGDGKTITIIAENGITTSDSDGSESFYVVVSGVPKGVVVQGGINNGDGSWTLPTGQAKVVLSDYTGAGQSTLTITTHVIDRDQNDGHTVSDTFTNTVSVDYGSGSSTGGGGAELTMDAAVTGTLSTTEDSALTLANLTIGVSDGGGGGYHFAVAGDGTVTGTDATGNAVGTVGTVSLVVQAPGGWGLSGSGLYLIGDVDGVKTYTVPYALRGGVTLTPPKDYAGTDVKLDVRAVVTDNHGHYDTTDAAGAMTQVPITVGAVVDGAAISASVSGAVEDAAAIPISLTVSDRESQNFSETLAGGTLTVSIAQVKGADGVLHLPGALQTGTLDNGAVVTAGATPGTYTIALTAAQQAAFNTGSSHGFTLAGLSFVPAANFAGSVSISFTASVQDTGVAAQDSISTISFTVSPVIDQTTFTAGAMAGNEDAAIALNLTINHQDLAGTDTWGSETASVVISGVPAGALIAGATNNGPTTINGVVTYSWTVDRSHLTITDQGIALKNVTYTSPPDDSSDAQLTFTTYVFEKGVAEPATSSATYTVTVNGVTDGAVLNPANANGFEDQATAIDLGAQLVDVVGTSEVTTITLTGVPEGSVLHNAAGGAVGTAGAVDATTHTQTWTFSAAEVQALGLMTGGKLYVVGPTNVSGSWTLTAQAFTQDIDGGNGAVVASNALPFTLTLAAVADAPTVTADTDVAVTEDGQASLNLRAALVDVDASESLSVIITGAPADSLIRVNTGTDAAPVWQDIHGQNGTWTISAGTALSLEKVYVQPPANYNGAFDLSVTATATEKTGGSANSVAKVVHVTVDAVNDAPTARVVSGGIGIETGLHTTPITLLKAADSVTFDDVDFKDANAVAVLSKMSVAIGGSGVSAHDSLSLSGVAVTLAEDGSLVTTTDTGGTIAVSYNPASHTLTFTGNASPAQFAELARHVVFSSTTSAVSAGTREITFTAYDAAGAASTGTSTGVTVTVAAGAVLQGAATGDVAFTAAGAPVLPAGTIATAEDAVPVALGLHLANAADPDLHVAITGMPAGTVFRDADGNAVDLSTLNVGQLPGLTIDLPDNWNGSATLTVSTSAGATTLTEQVTVTASAVNDAPTTTPVTLAGTAEDTAFTFTKAQLLAHAGDVDGDTLSVSGLAAAHGTIVDNHNGTYTYTPAINYHGTDAITYTIADGHNGTVAGNAGFTVTAVNDAPVAAVDHTAQTVSGTDSVLSSPLHVLGADATLSVSDVDGTTLTGLTVQLLPGAGGYLGGDTLGLAGHDIALNTSCQMVVQGTDILVAYDNEHHALTFSGSGSYATYADLAKSVVLSNTGTTMAAGTRAFSVTLYDEGHAASVAVNTTLDLTDGTTAVYQMGQDAHGTVYWNGTTPVLNADEDGGALQVHWTGDWSVNGNGGTDTLMLDCNHGDWVFAVDNDGALHATMTDAAGIHDGIINVDSVALVNGADHPFDVGQDQVVFNGSATGSIDFVDGGHVDFHNLEKIHG